MARVRSAAILLAATLLSTGCFNSTTLIKVKPDGSGIVEQTLTMNTEMLKQLAGMMGAMASGGEGKVTTKGPTSPDDLLTEDEARKMAERMGPGVRFVSRTPVKDATGEGAKVILFVRGHQQGRRPRGDISFGELREDEGRPGPLQDGARRRRLDADGDVPR